VLGLIESLDVGVLDIESLEAHLSSGGPLWFSIGVQVLSCISKRS
jgi:hypothetical protein